MIGDLVGTFLLGLCYFLVGVIVFVFLIAPVLILLMGWIGMCVEGIKEALHKP